LCRYLFQPFNLSSSDIVQFVAQYFPQLFQQYSQLT
jgi:hypothetical protein